MKKSKLELNRETIRRLETVKLEAAKAGICFPLDPTDCCPTQGQYTCWC